MKSRAKNVVWITADEMRGDSWGGAGNADVPTPRLDALAERGSVLENHFTPYPKCVPARCAMHTGRYCHTDGLRTVMPDNHLPEGAPTLAECLRGHGYETAVLGLNHVWEAGRFYGTGERTNQKSAGAVDYTSFTEGRMAELAEQAHDRGTGVARTGPHFEALEAVDYKGLVTGVESNFHDDNWADQACAYLSELRDPQKPFFLQLNFNKPHPAYAVHEPFYSMIDPARIRPFPYELPENAPLPLRAQRRWRLGDEVPEAALREIQAVYYGMVAYIDSLVGQVLDCLEAQGLVEDTLILFTSDHGDYAGQYGINEKWDSSLQDCLLHVPFIMAGPGVPAGRRVAGLSEHVDLPATMLDYLGLERPEGWNWHGRSLLPMLDGAAGKEAVFAEGGHEAPMRARLNTPAWSERDGRRIKTTGGKQLTYRECPDSMARAKMVRTEKWKLVVRETGGDELYDLTSDPRELRNRIDDGRYADVVRQLQRKLLAWCLRTDPDQPRVEQVGA
ncbi:MAG: sulfatase-like hydrolase/transferase [Verrucomicrobia bacterium]|jgi:choline-sulfatase|nr:sulfatase-like hydrolase/transferase [Verrucomicrobiota bacterium]